MFPDSTGSVPIGQFVRLCKAEGNRKRSLRVGINEQNPLALLGKTDAEISAGGRLSHAALLVSDGDDLTFFAYTVNSPYYYNQPAEKRAAM